MMYPFPIAEPPFSFLPNIFNLNADLAAMTPEALMTISKIIHCAAKTPFYVPFHSLVLLIIVLQLRNSDIKRHIALRLGVNQRKSHSAHIGKLGRFYRVLVFHL